MSEDTSLPILAVAKDCYLQWKEMADQVVWSSHPLWSNLSESQRGWWVKYVEDVHERVSRLNAHKVIACSKIPIKASFPSQLP